MSKKVWSTNIERDTLKNKFWRKVIFTSKHMQVVLMTIPPRQELNWEVHNDTDQFFRIESGTGVLLTRSSKKGVETKTRLSDGIAAVVPENVYHNLRNISYKTPLTMYTIYSPPHHPRNTIDKTHADELKRESRLK